MHAKEQTVTIRKILDKFYKICYNTDRNTTHTAKAYATVFCNTIPTHKLSILEIEGVCVLFC